MALTSSIKILVTGANGQLGMEFRQLQNAFPGFEFLFASKEELPITDDKKVDQYFSTHLPRFCINCAAYTAVDKAEKERTAAYDVNANAVGILAAACKKYEVKFFHISTDYVFAGNATKPYTEADDTAPLNYYGYSKLSGEEKALKEYDQVMIFRTSWVYSSYGNNFVKTMLRLIAERERIGVVADQYGSPTYAADLANAIMQIIAKQNFVPGIFHYCNTGIITWHQFAQAIREISRASCRVDAITTADYPTPAKRPSYSALDTQKFQQTFHIPIPQWRESLEHCLGILRSHKSS